MGILRLLLAIAVLVDHSVPLLGFHFIPGRIAVEAFFVISGFYMSMVLSEKYFKIEKYYRLFIGNRLLRLYPIYYSVLMLSVAYALVMGLKRSNFAELQVYLDHWSNLKWGTKIYLIGMNLTIIGQDTTLFLKTTKNGALEFTENSFLAQVPLFRFMLIPQAWTLSLELMFYAICPLFVKMKIKLIIAIIFILILLRFVAIQQGLIFDPWTYRFFPLELVFFLTGIASHHLYRELLKIKIATIVFVGILAYVILFTLFFESLPFENFKAGLYLLSIALSIPFLFIYTKKSRIDRMIGELSYPFYICHILVLNMTDVMLKKMNLSGVYQSGIALGITLILSIFLTKYIGKRIESYRSRRVGRQMRGIKIVTGENHG